VDLLFLGCRTPTVRERVGPSSTWRPTSGCRTPPSTRSGTARRTRARSCSRVRLRPARAVPRRDPGPPTTSPSRLLPDGGVARPGTPRARRRGRDHRGHRGRRLRGVRRRATAQAEHHLLRRRRGLHRLRPARPPAHARDRAGHRRPGALHAAPRADEPGHPRHLLRPPHLRRGHRAHALGRASGPSCRARRRPPDRRADGAPRQECPSSATACGSPTPRPSTSPAWCWWARSTATSWRHQRPRPARRRPVRRGRRPHPGQRPRPRPRLRRRRRPGEPGHPRAAARRGPHPGGLHHRRRRRAGQAYNINADTVAGASPRPSAPRRSSTSPTSRACSPTSTTPSSLIASIDAAELQALIADGTITGGMIPKVAACLHAVERRRRLRPHARRPAAARAAARAVHRRRHRHHDHPPPTDPGGRTAMTATAAPPGHGRAAELEHCPLMPTYGAPRSVRARRGHRAVGRDGTRYLDFLSGLAVTSLGHATPRWPTPSPSRPARCCTCRTSSAPSPAGEVAPPSTGCSAAAARSSSATPAPRPTSAPSSWPASSAARGRHVVVSAYGSFHGRTLATLHATGQPAKHEAFQPLPEGFRHVAWNDLDALEQALDPPSPPCCSSRCRARAA
jgi:hypothetical protein